MSKPQIVYIEWVDSSTAHGWRKEYSPGPLDCVSVGFLVKSTRDRVVITDSWAKMEDGKDDPHCVSEIPRCAIKKIVKLGGVPVPTEKSVK